MKIKKAVIKFFLKIFGIRFVIAGSPAIIINKKEEILLGKRDKNASFYPLMWGLPGGMIEYKETVEDAVKRELKEELGINIKIIRYGKPRMHLPNKECPLQILDIPAYCKIVNGKPSAEDGTSDVRWFKPKEIKKIKLAYTHKTILKQEGII